MKKLMALGLAAAAVAGPSLARAGGFEFPDNGTEALGRGGAFTAKASDATALEYNLAGLAQQRGWRLMFDSNLVFNTYDFQRAGSYPDANTASTPWGGVRYPPVHNKHGVFYAPFVGLSTDFDRLDRWTFAIGLYGPSSVGQRDYGTSVTLPGGISAGAPSRYDVTKVDLLLAFPTLAGSVRITRWFDLGLALQVVYGSFDVANASLVYGSNTLCLNLEDQNCDSSTHITASTITATAKLGLMFHPVRGLHIGADVRPEVTVDAVGGHAVATPPKEFGASFMIPPAGDIEFHTKLPWEARLGIRYAFKGADDFEHGDIELDGTYEAWHHAEGDGDHIVIPNLGPLSNINPDITHHYQDTFSARLGGAYNLRVGRMAVLAFRLGGYFDSAATKYKDTRLDFDTMAKWGATAGIGATVRGITLNFAYAYVYEPDRTVTNGDIRVINGVEGGGTTAMGQDTPVFNNGHYHARNQIVSIGLTVAWAELLGRRRIIRWQ
jgi:long-subunit fatty acid transport protein